MSKAIVITKTGGPEVLQIADVTVGAPGAGEIRLKQTAAGVNFIDVYHRTGLYKIDGAFTPGMEGAGVVEAVGDGVSDLKPGDRVAYGNGPIGGYAEHRVMPADKVVKVPGAVTDEQAAAMMLRGLTVWYLLYETFPVKSGDTILVHAAAGGIGLILCQWANHMGATVIGTVGSEDKARKAQAAGCHHAILYKQEDWVAKVRALTGGAGVPVVYDGVGKDTFAGSLDCLKPRGLMVNFGNASGPAPAFEPNLLAAKGSLYLTRPRLMDYFTARSDYVRGAQALFDVVARGVVKIDIGQVFALADAGAAHRALESRATTGSTILKI